ncbi:MAG: hypothetical protein KDD67_00505 [Ignavibacteriae bacterium]|nr:hypothetical protein [Ignavibacteriota bacterium]MCB9214682.1 hypothetical protein [Ignavibacteria bacterium]
MKRQVYIPLLIIIGITPLMLGMVSVGSPVPTFSIEDQYEKTWKTSNYSGKPALYVVCDRDAYDYVENWTKKLVPKYKENIHFVPVADVTSVPGFLKGYIRGRFKDEFKYPVLMDWEGILVKGLNMKAGHPTLVLTDGSGIVKYRAWGKGSDDEVTKLEKKIKDLVGEE